MAEVTQLLPRRRPRPVPVTEAPRDQTRVVQATGSARSVVGAPPHSDAGSVQAVGVGTLIKERFELTEMLGMGGMGVVYKALDRRQSELGESDPWVAIKVLNKPLAREGYAMAALQQESRRCQKLAHPTIVNVHDFDRDGDRVFMTMECLSGQSLEAWVMAPDFRGAPLHRVKLWLKDIGDALLYAHRQGVVHSDLKPSNIFITDEGRAKVFDFGIARAMHAVQAPASTGNLIAYTPAYASLAMLQGAPPDPADDAYALACVLYLLLSGRHPYQRKTADVVVHERLSPERLPILSRRQWRVLQRLLEPEQRHSQGVAELLAVFCEPGSRLGRAAVLTATILAVSIMGAVIGDQVQHRTRYQLAEALQSAQWHRVKSALDTLPTIPGEDRSWALEASRDNLLNALQARVARLSAHDPATELSALLEQLAIYYPDSLTLLSIRQQYTRQQQQWVDSVLAAIDRLLEAELPTPRAVQELRDYWQWLAHGHPVRFAEGRHRYQEAVAQQANRLLYAGRVDVAHALLKQALAQWPDSDGLANVAARVDRYRQTSGRVLSSATDVSPLQTHHLSALARVRKQAAVGESLAVLWPELVRLYRDVDTPLGEALQSALVTQLDAYLADAKGAGQDALRASLREVGRQFEPEHAGFQEPLIRHDACRSDWAGKGEWPAFRCRDRLTAAQWGPRLVVIPAAGRHKAYAISQHEISVGDFNLFCRLFRQCQEAKRPAHLPMTNISVEQARAYVRWLSRLSGRQYRLPDWQRWVHAVTANQLTAIPDHQCHVAHAGQLIRGGKPRPIDQGQPNSWGVRNGLGNVAEWVEDAGRLGIAGGHFDLPLSQCQPHTYQVDEGRASATTGFRVLRELESG